MQNFIIAAAVLLLFIPASTNAATEWNKGKITEILPEGTILIGKDTIKKVAGIDYDQFHNQDKCFLRPIIKTLQKDWIGKNIQWREEGGTALIKNTKQGNLSEYMLQKGMARLNNEELSSYYKGKFQKATTEAKKQKLGIWKGCSKEHAKRKIRLIRKKQYFMDQYEGFLAPVSTGKVVNAQEGNLIELENKVRVKLIGVNIPENEGHIENCFREQSRKFLSNLLVGRTVILRADRVNFDQEGTLLRYAYLPSWRKNGDELLVNQHLIESGYAKSHWPDKNIKHQKEFMSLQRNLYQSPRGAWSFCFANALTKKNEEPEKAFDENCPIKGNISGTKSNPIKKYHTPHSPWYNRITKPERCFSTEEEAAQEGFEKVR